MSVPRRLDRVGVAESFASPTATSPPARERDRPSLNPRALCIQRLGPWTNSRVINWRQVRLEWASVGDAPTPTQRVQVGLANLWQTAGGGSRPRDRSGTGLGLGCWFGVEPPAGIEPATPSLPWNHQEPLCGSPFPQVTPDRKGQSYRFSSGAVMRSPRSQVRVGSGSWPRVRLRRPGRAGVLSWRPARGWSPGACGGCWRCGRWRSLG